MQERLMNIVLGDWSNDGHGRTDTVYVKLYGDDLSDKRLHEAFQQNVDDAGFDPLLTFTNSQTMPEEHWQRLYDLGYDPDACINDPKYEAVLNDGFFFHDDEEQFYIPLLMFFITRNTEIQWEAATMDTLFGGSNPVAYTADSQYYLVGYEFYME